MGSGSRTLARPERRVSEEPIMPLSGKGMLITLMDADPGEERDFSQWYDKEHIIERVSIPGFLEARRYVAVAAEPKYLNFYPTETLDVLRSPDYLKALQNPTAWTRHHMPRFRNFTRAVARVTASRGQGRGGALAFSRIRASAADRTELRNAVTAELDAVLDQVISAHLLESDPELSKPADAAAPDVGSADWYVVVEATDEPAVRQLADQRFGSRAKLPRAETIAFGTYRLLWDLAKAEL
jgi:hypothetical protein